MALLLITWAGVCLGVMGGQWADILSCSCADHSIHPAAFCLDSDQHGGVLMQDMRKHIEQLRPAVEELARIETEAQYSFLHFLTAWQPSPAAAPS